MLSLGLCVVRVLDAVLGFGVHALDQKAHQGGALFWIELHRFFKQFPRRLCHASILSLWGADCRPSNARLRLYATRSGARSACVTGGRSKRRKTRFSAIADSLPGAVISMPIGLPLRLKSITKPGSAFAVRYLFSPGRRDT